MKKLEMLIGRVVLNILGGVIMAGLIIGIFALLGLLVQVIETHFWLMIPLVLIVIYLIFQECMCLMLIVMYQLH